MRFFNNAGPIKPKLHYHIDPLHRLDWEEISHYIAQQRYFVLHAPRQTGKTTTLLAMMHALNQGDDYTALYVNIEGAQAARGDVNAGIGEVLGALTAAAVLYLGDERPGQMLAKIKTHRGMQGALGELLTRWCQQKNKPLVLMLDEVDSLVGDTLISLLRQIRAGYEQRPAAFPQSLILCGVRDIRDYRIHTQHKEIITGGSAFNIKAESLRMGNFTQEETRELWIQHSKETGQIFSESIFPELWEDTRGQPWLVNALGHEVIWKDRSARNREKSISLEDYKAARERLIQSRATHLDQLTDKLREPRVHKVIAALLSTEETQLQMPQDDMDYVEDIGLIRRRPHVHISNRIYQEIIPRELTRVSQDFMIQESSWYMQPDGRLDMEKLLAAFQQFFREHSESWIERFAFKEAGPQLLMQAFLQRIVNGGGRVNREYGLGRRRTDLLIEWPLDQGQGFWGPVQKVVIELKLLHKGKKFDTVLQEGLVQTADYADKAGAEEAHLMIFNRRADIPWEQKIMYKTMIHEGRTIGMWGV
jgi:hypothetical protein